MPGFYVGAEAEAPSKFVENLLSYLLQKSSLLVTQRFHAVLGVQGMSLSRWKLLAWLVDGETIPLSRLASDLMMDQSSTTRLVDRAAQDGLVRKEADPLDGRRALVSITPAGRSVISPAQKNALIVDAMFANTYGKQEITALKRSLRALIHFLEHQE